MQGFGKFGFYEIFKDVYKGIVGKENAEKYKAIGWSISSASAEVIADTLLCPFEAIKVRMQTDMKGEFPKQIGEAWGQIMKNEGWNGFYRGLVPLWC
jgi:solute carrier family 25 (mitochondrial phosphate transporter), member 3